MLIKMTNGSFGYREKTPEGYSLHVVGKTRLDPPFEVDEEVGNDLIARGVAVRVDGPQEAPAQAAPPEGMIEATMDGGQFEDMTVAELKKLAVEMGLDVSGIRKKADLIDLITSEIVYVDEEDGPPELTDGDLV